MKRVLSFILALTMTLTLCACGSGSGKLSPYLMDFQFGAGEEATEKTILDLEKNDTFTVNGIEFSSVSADYCSYETAHTLLLPQETMNFISTT